MVSVNITRLYRLNPKVPNCSPGGTDVVRRSRGAQVTVACRSKLSCVTRRARGTFRKYREDLETRGGLADNPFVLKDNPHAW